MPPRSVRVSGAGAPVALGSDDRELRKRLTVGSVACTSMYDESRTFTSVGAGSCGTVFSAGPGTPHVYKFANPSWLDGEMGLLNDDYAHVLMLQSFENYKLSGVKIPKHYQLFDQDAHPVARCAQRRLPPSPSGRAGRLQPAYPRFGHAEDLAAPRRH